MKTQSKTTAAVLQLHRQRAQHKVLVVWTVADVTVVETLAIRIRTAASGHRGGGSCRDWRWHRAGSAARLAAAARFRSQKSQPVLGVGPRAHRLAKHKRQHDDHEEDQHRGEGGRHQRQIVRDHDALDDATLGKVVGTDSLVDVESAPIRRPGVAPVVAPDVARVHHFVRVVRDPGGQLLQELAPTRPRVAAERQLHQPSVQRHLPHRERDQSVAAQS